MSENSCNSLLPSDEIRFSAGGIIGIPVKVIAVQSHPVINKPPMRILSTILEACFFALFSMCACAADHPFQITSADGDYSIAFGILGQAQAERIRTTTGIGNSQDLFLRRFRLIAGGKLSKKLSFFVDTDSPNLGKGTAAGGKVEDRIYLQDAVITYTVRPEFQIDGGMLLIANSHNSVQSAATLLPIDYGPYTFVASDPTQSRVGRDYGVQARGYLFHQHFEYRGGVFQGSRAKIESHPGTTNEFRYSGRVVWYPFEAETGFFYTGTTLGAKRILAIGAAFDHQMEYNARSVDVFFDQPLRHGDGLTLQAGYTHFDGGTTFAQLPREHVWLVEAGYYNKRTKLGPFMQLSNRLFSDPQTSDIKKYLGGVAYWALGHRFNVKFGVGRSLGSTSTESWQVVLQGQAFVY
jgi:hypothetical protein